MSAGVILFVAFAACLVIGVPVSISLGVASLLRTCRKPDDKRWYLPPYRKLC